MNNVHDHYACLRSSVTKFHVNNFWKVLFRSFYTQCKPCTMCLQRQLLRTRLAVHWSEVDR